MSAHYLPVLIGDLLDGAAIAPRLNVATRRQALVVVAEVAARASGLASQRILEALLKRKSTEPTGIGHGVAIPHADIDGLDRMRGIFARLETPVDFHAVDDEPVDLIFALLAPPDSGRRHLLALARISRLLRRPDLRRQLRQARTADALHALLTRESLASAA